MDATPDPGEGRSEGATNERIELRGTSNGE